MRFRERERNRDEENNCEKSLERDSGCERGREREQMEREEAKAEG